MSVITTQWHQYLSASLENLNLEKRECIADFLMIDQVYNRLHSDKPWPIKGLYSLTVILKDEVTTINELQVYSDCLRLIYEKEQPAQPQLTPPSKINTMPKMPAAISAKELTPESIVNLLKVLYQADDINLESMSSEDIKVAWGKLLLMVAFESNLTTLSELNEFIKIPLAQWNGYSSTNDITFILPKNHRRVWMQPCSVLFYTALIKDTQSPIILQKAQAKALIKCYQQTHFHNFPEIEETSVERLIRDIGLFQHPIGLRNFWQHEQALPNHVITRLFSNDTTKAPEERSHTQSKIVLAITNEYNDNRYLDHDVSLHVHSIFNTFVLQNKNESRNCKAFKLTVEQLDKCLDKNISEGLYLSLFWIIDLFKNGSLWKGKLTVSTLKNYFSTLISFQKRGYKQCNLQQMSSDEISKHCQNALSNFNNSEQQFTVLRFLLFMNQCPAIPNVNNDELLLMDNKGVIRCNYLTPTEFEHICRSFLENKGIYEQKIVFFMRCCYYIGLREDEALHLKVGDINQFTNLTSITPDKRRKSANAIRDIPECLFPETFINELKEVYQQQRAIKSEDDYIFTYWNYSALEDQFIQYLRDYTKDSSWVTHLLRHCFANNMLIQLMLATQQLTSLPNFLQCDLFSNRQIEKIKTVFEGWGRALSKQFAILDWIGQTVGHSTPITTATIYLHLLDWINATRFNAPYPVSKKQLRTWLGGDSKYVFNLLNKIGSSDINHSQFLSIDKEAASKLALNRYCTAGGGVVTPLKRKKLKKPQEVICFSLFYDALLRLSMGSDDSFIDATIINFINQTNSLPLLPNLSKVEISAWVRLCQHLDVHFDNKMQSKTNALLFLKDKIESKEETTNMSDLKKQLIAMDALKLNGNTIQVKAKHESDAKKWIEEIEKYKFSAVLRANNQRHPSITVKPYQLHWKLWREITTIIDLTHYYNLYRKN